MWCHHLHVDVCASGNRELQLPNFVCDTHQGCRFQLRCVLKQPLTVYPGADVQGELRLVAHKRQSYDIHLRLTVPSLAPGVPDQTVRNPSSQALQAIPACNPLSKQDPSSV